MASFQQLDALLQRQRNRCALTGHALTPMVVSLDHVVPLSRGGSQDLANCQLTTRAANHAKGSMLHEEFVALCQDVVAEDRRRRRRKKAQAHRRRPRRRR